MRYQKRQFHTRTNFLVNFLKSPLHEQGDFKISQFQNYQKNERKDQFDRQIE